MPIAFESPDQPDIRDLIAALDAYLYSLYPADAVYALDLAALKQPNVLFAVARDDAGKAVGCCALVLQGEFGEVKRMYVDPACRGQGWAQRMLDHLEAAAHTGGCRVLMLETGPYQHEALALYQRMGFEVCGPFGDYPAAPLSIFMRKAVARAATVDSAQEAPAQATDSLIDLRERLRRFSAERDWERFHTPKNLVMALSVEVAELAEHFQWLQTGAATELNAHQHIGVRHELADVLLYLIQVADKMGVDLHAAALEKMILNGQKYPVEQVRGDP